MEGGGRERERKGRTEGRKEKREGVEKREQETGKEGERKGGRKRKMEGRTEEGRGDETDKEGYFVLDLLPIIRGAFLVAQMVKNLPAVQETQV